VIQNFAREQDTCARLIFELRMKMSEVKARIMLLSKANQVIIKCGGTTYIVMPRCDPVGNNVQGVIDSWPIWHMPSHPLKQQWSNLAVRHVHLWMHGLKNGI
jgi:hypothetical protein